MHCVEVAAAVLAEVLMQHDVKIADGSHISASTEQNA